MTLAWALDRIQHISFLLIIGLLLWEHDGFVRAERREEKMKAEYAFKGETVPEEIVPPRNLISNRRRRRIRQVSLAMFVIFVASTVATYVVK